MGERASLVSANAIVCRNCKNHHLFARLEVTVFRATVVVIKVHISIFISGVNTTVGASYAFLSLMTLYPDKQKKLQQEVDDVIGSRLPRLADRPKMHYMEAVSELRNLSFSLHYSNKK